MSAGHDRRPASCAVLKKVIYPPRPMSPLQTLAPDQRAVLELLLRQGRSYAELSELLGLPEEAGRERAHTALAALAPDRAAPIGEDGPVADWILGQASGEE